MADSKSPSSKNKKWQKEEEEQLWKMHKEGHSAEEISAALKRTAGAVKSRVSMLSDRGCPVPRCTDLRDSERGRNQHLLRKMDDAHKAYRQQKANEDQSRNEAQIAGKNQEDGKQLDNREPVGAVKEDEKTQSEPTESTEPKEADVVPSGWSPKVFTQIEVKVLSSQRVWVKNESWDRNERTVEYKYPSGGKIYHGMRWKFSEKEQKTEMEAMATRVIRLESHINDLEEKLQSQHVQLEEFRRMRQCQMELFQKGMENLKI